LRQMLTLSVSGGTTHTVPMDHLHRLQALVSEFGADGYPLFLRAGAVRNAELQPVTARAFLAEVEKFTPLITGRRVPGLSFRSAQGLEIGSIHGGQEVRPIAANDACSVSMTGQGIRVAIHQFPPPVGFRSNPTLQSGWYECYFQSLQHTQSGTLGERTPAMGGSRSLVPLPDLPEMPPPTKWDDAKVSSGAEVAATEFTETSAEEAFRDLLHAITAACNEALRLRRPLRIRPD